MAGLICTDICTNYGLFVQSICTNKSLFVQSVCTNKSLIVQSLFNSLHVSCHSCNPKLLQHQLNDPAEWHQTGSWEEEWPDGSGGELPEGGRGLLLGLCEREGQLGREGRGGRPGGEKRRQLEGRSDAKKFLTVCTISCLNQWAHLNGCTEKSRMAVQIKVKYVFRFLYQYGLDRMLDE